MRKDATSAPVPAPAVNICGRHLHFVGIGGSGMSGLARLCASSGAICTGSDRTDAPHLAKLRQAGIDLVLRQGPDTVPPQVDTLVISAAIPEDHPEVQAARQRDVPVVKYARMLGQLMAGRIGVAIAGTHGKSTTTSMLSHVAIQTGLDPAFIVGAHCAQIGGGARVSATGGPILIAEACEYDRSFHNFAPTHAAILNVEADHLDLYTSLDEIVQSFAIFARQVAPHGSLLIQHESPHRLDITGRLDCAVQTLGFAPQADWQIQAEGERGKVQGKMVRLVRGGDEVARWISPLPGEHMAYNAAVAAVMAHRLGADWDGIARAIASFQGLDRRMQQMGTQAGVTVVDDYGHHPTEIDTTLRALRHHYDPRRLVCVFQPHQHSRTRFLMDQFAASFSAADLVIVPDIYFVRDSETERQAVTAGDLVDRLRSKGVAALHMHPLDAIVEQLGALTREGDLLVTMGAGDVWKVARGFLKPLAA
jgi:UDP-N-acetylmuramate--alanine ligase